VNQINQQLYIWCQYRCSKLTNFGTEKYNILVIAYSTKGQKLQNFLDPLKMIFCSQQIYKSVARFTRHIPHTSIPFLATHTEVVCVRAWVRMCIYDQLQIQNWSTKTPVWYGHVCYDYLRIRQGFVWNGLCSIINACFIRKPELFRQSVITHQPIRFDVSVI